MHTCVVWHNYARKKNHTRLTNKRSEVPALGQAQKCEGVWDANPTPVPLANVEKTNSHNNTHSKICLFWKRGYEYLKYKIWNAVDGYFFYWLYVASFLYTFITPYGLLTFLLAILE